MGGLEGRLVWGERPPSLPRPPPPDLLLRACLDSAAAQLQEPWVAASERPVEGCLYQLHVEARTQRAAELQGQAPGGSVCLSVCL